MDRDRLNHRKVIRQEEILGGTRGVPGCLRLLPLNPNWMREFCSGKKSALLREILLRSIPPTRAVDNPRVPATFAAVLDSKTEQPGRFEHYRLMTDADGKPVKLGEGAMGVTYLAEDTNLRVKVALKVIAPALLGDAEIVQRFQREAQAAARLRHPNVAAVYHLGTVDDTFFYTMEFVEGQTLREHVAKHGPLSIKQALEVTLQICEALGAAERHQMVHRDIKPANIMLETTEDGLHAKLIDFGLAKPLQQDAQQTSALLTQRGTFLGTAVFASPEQVQDLPLDTRSDFYALGLTLWYMLESRPPFEGSLHKVLYDQVHTKPPLDRLMWAPAEVRALLEKLLEKLSTARPQTARELRQMIHDCLRALASGGTSQADWQQRFQVRQAPRQQPWGSIYEGQDTLSGAVWLQFLRSNRFSSVDALKDVIAEVRRAIEIHHPNVLRHVTVFPTSDTQGAGWMVVTEHPGAHTLLAHLQKVKQLAANEAMPLMERLGEALDCCLANDLPAADLDPARIYLKPQAALTGDAPIEVVPKLCPINYSVLAALRAGDEDSGGLTQIVPRNEARTARDAVQRLATLAYQCLGGSWGRANRYIPLPGLTQRQNETLREALAEKKYTRASELIDALQQAKAPRQATAAPKTEAEATVTLSPWERLAALASPTLTGEGVVSEMVDPAAATRALAPKAEPAPAPEEVDLPSESAEMPEEELSFPEVPELGTEPEPSLEEEIVPSYEVEAPAVEEEEPAPTSANEEPASVEAFPEEPEPPVEVPATTEPAVAPAASSTSSGSASAVRTSAAELPLVGQRIDPKRTNAIAALRETVEREWRDAKPIIDKVAKPVHQTVTTLPRWVFIASGCFIAVVAIALWAIANRPMSALPQQETDPGKTLAITKQDINSTKPAVPVPPQPPPPPSLDQLLVSGTEAATQGDHAALLKAWQEMQKRFPDKWAALAKSAAFVSAVTSAWQENKLGDPAKAALDYLAIISLSAKDSDVGMLKKLSEDLKADAPTAQRFELALLNTLSEDSGKLEMMLDESLRLVQARKTGAVAERARELIRQELGPIVAVRERNPRPEDQTVALRNAYQALAPKLEGLSTTDEPTALYLYADKLKLENRTEEALKVFEKAARLDHPPSMVKYGLLLSDQPDKATSMPRAVQWFKMADSKGYAKAAFFLGECYLDGSGVPRDYDMALQLLNKAASQDIREAHYLLGGTYLGFGRPRAVGATDEFDPAKLDPSLTGEDRLKKSRGHLEKAWNRGYAPAGPLLAQMLIIGQGGKADLKQGFEVLDAVVKLPPPNVDALRNLALLLTDEDVEGLPTPKERRAAGIKSDARRAEQLMREAAKLGDEPAKQWCADKGVPL